MVFEEYNILWWWCIASQYILLLKYFQVYFNINKLLNMILKLLILSYFKHSSTFINKVTRVIFHIYYFSSSYTYHWKRRTTLSTLHECRFTFRNRRASIIGGSLFALSLFIAYSVLLQSLSNSATISKIKLQLTFFALFYFMLNFCHCFEIPRT